MTVGSGLGGYFGVAAETTGAYGTPATPTRFYRAQKAELKKVKNTVQGGGFSAGQLVQEGIQRVVTTTAGTGSIDLQVGTKSFGLLLAHIFGSSATAAQQASSTAYLQSHALGDNFGKSLTMQAGVVDRPGTSHPYSLLGSKVTTATFSCAVDQLLTLSIEADGQQLVESLAAASPSYVTGVKPFHFGQMAVKKGTYGAETAISGVKGFSLQFARPQDTAGFYAGATVPGTKSEPVSNDWVAVSGSLDMDLVDKTAIADLFASDASTSLVIEFLGATIASTYRETCRFIMPMTFFTGDTPTLSNMGVTTGSFPFVSQFDLTNAPISCQYMSSDTTV